MKPYIPYKLKPWVYLFVVFLLSGEMNAQKVEIDKKLAPLYKELIQEYPVLSENKIKCDSIIFDEEKKNVNIHLSKHLESIPFREETVHILYDSIFNKLSDISEEYDIELFINKYKVNDLIPNAYRKNLKLDKGRFSKKKYEGDPIITNQSKPFEISQGLQKKHIALWASHGWYYDQNEKSWLWQRPRLFQVAEDTYTNSFVLPYLVPMLENAGAIVFLPRERDTQLNEIVIDNDDTEFFLYEERNDNNQAWSVGDSCGFANPKEYYVEGENPFEYGTYRKIRSQKEGNAYASWTPDIPEKGEYAVYISYQTEEESTDDAHYTVYHSGGETSFTVNQNMGGGTWIYLGTFDFDKGINPESGKVVLSNNSKTDGKFVTADAVKFGGGISNIGKSLVNESGIEYSGKARFLEAARYWLQWAGYPDSVYNKNQDKSDYKDDYMCRGEWVNNLIGGSVKSPQTKGKNIPIDMAMGFHTDAGQVPNDSIIGTLTIYMSESNGKKEYTNGQRRIVARDLADLVQTQIVDDIRKTFRPDWSRRKMTDQSYYEARVPEVPTFLLELLSHQNFTDMKYGLDPNFKFLVSRSVYKGMLKYLAFQDKTEYIVQPLPVKQFSAEFRDKSKNQVFLSWTAQGDSLESTAEATQFILYTSHENGGWDNGQIIEKPYTIVTINPGEIYNFKVTALNKGGESFPSEVLSVCNIPESKGTVLIVNGFHRVAAPEAFDIGGYSGFLDKIDRGVPDHYDISYTGSQYRFNKKAIFRGNRTPGHGASYADFENDVIAGNTFDFPFSHGKAIRNAGYSFVSCSDEAINNGDFNVSNYFAIDLILGKEKETFTQNTYKYRLFPKNLRETLTAYLKQGGNLFASGAYIASDIVERDSCDENTIRFMEETLRYKLKESRVKSKGIVSNYFSIFEEFKTQYYNFYYLLNRYQYAIENSDAIDSTNGSSIIFSYEGNNLPAAVGYRGKYKTLISAVPFETIESDKDRNQMMKEILNFFEK